MVAELLYGRIHALLSSSGSTRVLPGPRGDVLFTAGDHVGLDVLVADAEQLDVVRAALGRLARRQLAFELGIECP